MPQMGNASGSPQRRSGLLLLLFSAMSEVKRLGLLAAMPPEIEKLKQNVDGQEDHKHGIFTFTTGTLAGRPVVFAAANVSNAVLS